METPPEQLLTEMTARLVALTDQVNLLTTRAESAEQSIQTLIAHDERNTERIGRLDDYAQSIESQLVRHQERH